ncbi:MAG: UbiA family prenyltransferase, partial [Bacillota bacterium]|nr:UbiA family prenyltransferase [Bacillota bacterium]
LPIALFLFIIYSYSKRFTGACHIILGIACAVAPAGAWIAVTGGLDLPGLIICAADVLWVAGFDIIYAVQDREFDVKEGLHSIPVKLGANRSYLIAAVFHSLMILFLFALGIVLSLPWLYFCGIILIALLLIYENLIARPKGGKKIIFAAYNLNKIISVIFLLTVLLSIFLF